MSVKFHHLRRVLFRVFFEMHAIISKQILNAQYCKIEIAAEGLSQKLCPGQFIKVMVDTESYPQAVATVDIDPIKKTLSIIFSKDDALYQMLEAKKIGEYVHALQGPFAEPFVPLKFGRVICVGVNQYNVNNLTFCRALTRAGNRVMGVAAYQTRKNVFLESQFRANCDDSVIVTTDGSYDTKGSVIDVIQSICQKQTVNAVVASGPLVQLQQIAQAAEELKVVCFLNLAVILEFGINHECRSPLYINGRSAYLGFTELIKPSSEIDIQELIDQEQMFKEFNDCQHLINRITQPSRPSRSFTKLLAGLLKRKP